ncbi:MAG: signal recognition particle-docking protein FtsY, partial [Dehalococcoidales bacterium]|nr:signal recognition particle-docking protein FtsY [Dehalococcoidales bacterium]
EMISILDLPVPEPVVTTPPHVILVIGVNGSGKTTSIAKLAYQAKSAGQSVLLAAGDTFRAAAIDQLKTWAERIGVDIVAHQPGADPGAVVYDAMSAAKNRGTQLLIIDTAGRLHTRFNLMEELKKIKRVTAKTDPTAPHEVILVLDATTGQNGLAQAKTFTEATGVTSIFLAKLDGTAKGGIALAICDQLKIPVKYIGTGEHAEDLARFDARSFVEALSGDES